MQQSKIKLSWEKPGYIFRGKENTTSRGYQSGQHKRMEKTAHAYVREMTNLKTFNAKDTFLCLLEAFH